MELAIDYAVKALYLVMILSLPPIIVASVVGIVLSLIQAITSCRNRPWRSASSCWPWG